MAFSPAFSIGFMLDAIAWLETHKNQQKGVVSPRKITKRKYVFDQVFSTTHFGIVVEDKTLYLGVNNNAAQLAQWFPNVSWKSILLPSKGPSRLLMVTNKIDMSKVPSIKNTQVLPEFAIELSLHNELSKILAAAKTLSLGSFRLDQDHNMEMVYKNPLKIPIVSSSIS